MIKYWNHADNFGYAGFFLEMLAYAIFTGGLQIQNYPGGMLNFFHKGVRWLNNGWAVPDSWSGPPSGLYAGLPALAARCGTCRGRADLVHADGSAYCMEHWCDPVLRTGGAP